MTTTVAAQTFIVEYSKDGGATWHAGTTWPMRMLGELTFASVLRHERTRHGQDIQTRVSYV